MNSQEYSIQHSQIEVFRTNVQTKKDADTLISEITKFQPVVRINFDLDDCDKILRIEAATIDVQLILNVLQNKGFNCILLD